MRGVHTMIQTIRDAKYSSAIIAAVFAISVLFAAAGIYQINQTPAQAASCSGNNIVPAGTHSYADVTRAYNANECGDLKAIYDHYWIKPTIAAGDRVVVGEANNRGEVVADGRVVAKNAASVGRHAIQHSKPIAIKGKTYYQTTHVGGKAFANPNASLKTIIVLDANGNFKYAIVMDCGNPIYATPVPPPEPPKPPVKDIKVCDLGSKKIITIKEDQFNPELHSKNLADCADKYIKVCRLEDKKIVSIKEDEFDQAKYSKNLDDCKEVKIQVCELDSKKIITINETEFDASKHSKNLADCKTPEKMVVCELETKNTITINKDEFDASKHSENLDDCKEVPPVTPPAPTPPELPHTGAGDLIGAGIGLSAMGLAAYYYIASRRVL